MRFESERDRLSFSSILLIDSPVSIAVELATLRNKSFLAFVLSFKKGLDCVSFFVFMRISIA